MSKSKEMSVNKRGTGSIWAYVNLVCTIAGGGPPVVAFCLGQSGWLGLLAIPIIGWVAWYSGRLLLECSYVKPGIRLASYPEVVREAFGVWGERFIKVVHYSILLSVTTLYIMFSGINLQAISEDYHWGGDVRWWTWGVGAVVTIPYLIAREIREVIWVSLLGLISAILTVIIGSIAGFLDDREFITHYDTIRWEGIPTCLAIISFTFGGNVIFHHIEAQMAHPKSWSKVLAYAIITVSTLYLIISILGYYVYGNQIQNPIMLSLPPQLPKAILNLVITLHFILATPLILLSFSTEIEPHLPTPLWSHPILRLSTVILLTLLAIHIPHFSAFISLIGSIGGFIVMYIVPPLCHLKLFGWKGRSSLTYLAMSICLLVGIFAGSFGPIDAIQMMFKELSS